MFQALKIRNDKIREIAGYRTADEATRTAKRFASGD
jgi:hypothetical protein